MTWLVGQQQQFQWKTIIKVAFILNLEINIYMHQQTGLNAIAITQVAVYRLTRHNSPLQ